MIRDIYLYGSLADQFGRHHRYDVATAVEAGRALDVTLPGFRQAIRDGSFRVVRGDLDNGLQIDQESLCLLLGDAPLHIVPVVAGAKDRGIGKLILGIALIGVGYFGGFGNAFISAGGETLMTYGKLATLGAGIALGGVAQILSPAPDMGSHESPDKRPSFMFNGAQNLTEQGNPVPLVYGRCRVGSVTVSAGMAAEEVVLND